MLLRIRSSFSSCSRERPSLAVVVGLARGCRFISRLGDSQGFVAHKLWLSPKRLKLPTLTLNCDKALGKQLTLLAWAV